MTEETVFRVLNLPGGRDYIWYPDLNVVALRRGMNCEQKMLALDEFQSHWRREHLRLVGSA